MKRRKRRMPENNVVVKKRGERVFLLVDGVVVRSRHVKDKYAEMDIYNRYVAYGGSMLSAPRIRSYFV
jgi:hypothetical protein